MAADIFGDSSIDPSMIQNSIINFVIENKRILERVLSTHAQLFPGDSIKNIRQVFRNFEMSSDAKCESKKIAMR